MFLGKNSHVLVTDCRKCLILRTFCRAHNPKVGGSNPSPATLNKTLILVKRVGVFAFMGPLGVIVEKASQGRVFVPWASHQLKASDQFLQTD